MQLACPKCGTRDTRISNLVGPVEMAKSWFGVYQMRCRRCRTRWETSVWHGGAWRYARCPRCYRQQLTTWSEQYYHPPKVMVLMLRMGATPYRCAACRCNFASFKPCKEKFSWRHETKAEVGSPRLSPTGEADPIPSHAVIPPAAGSPTAVGPTGVSPAEAPESPAPYSTKPPE